MKDLTKIVVLLDRSGSMESARENTIRGLNTFIKEQKEIPGEASLKLVQFDECAGLQYDTIYSGDLKDAKELTSADFVPRGLTPLLDAQGKTINELGSELEALPESERPNKVIVVTITDGVENASREFTRQKIKAMIKHQTEVYGWDFVYIGANQDAVAVGQTLGIPAMKSMTYNIQNAQAVNQTYSNLSSYVTRGRAANATVGLVNNVFTEDEKETSMSGA